MTSPIARQGQGYRAEVLVNDKWSRRDETVHTPLSRNHLAASDDNDAEYDVNPVLNGINHGCSTENGAAPLRGGFAVVDF